MIETTQFILWILRKIFKLPRRWYDFLLDCYDNRDWYIPVIAIIFGVGFVGGILGLITSEIFKDGKIGGAVCFTTWIIGLGFIVTAGIHALYLVFKQEQQHLIDTLKRNG